MKVSEMIAQLEEQLENEGDIEVRIMSQPNWPFEYEIEGLVSSKEIAERTNDPADDEPEDREPPRVFVLEGRQVCYGNKDAWEH